MKDGHINELLDANIAEYAHRVVFAPRWLGRRANRKRIEQLARENAGLIEADSWEHQADPADDYSNSAISDPPTDRLQLGAHAKQLLDDPVLMLALDKLSDDLVQTWRSTTVGDSEAREAAYRMHWAIEGARSKLQALLGDAKMIEAEAKRREAEEERKRARAG